MSDRIFKSIFFTALAVSLALALSLAGALYGVYGKETNEQMQREAALIGQALSLTEDKNAFLQKAVKGYRVTLIAGDGHVVYDNQADASTMESHADRPEFLEAVKTGSGTGSRYSATLSEKTTYYALRLESGEVLRLSKTQQSLMGLLYSMYTLFALVTVALAAVSFWVATVLARRIAAPINGLDLDAPLNNQAYEELKPLLERLQRQKLETRSAMRALTAQQKEFSAVTENMREGLFVLNRNDEVLSANRSAASILNMRKEELEGRPLEDAAHLATIQNILKAFHKEEAYEEDTTINGRRYTLFSNPVSSEESEAGGVILALDVTDRYEAEKTRREFTANVTHELKTPLTSIIGYAEIMQNGIAKEEDMRRFAGRIYSEASRLITLVNDILRLSQLDEKAKLPEAEDVDLRELANEAVARLRPLAEKRHITLSVSGESVFIHGARAVLDEMVYNLCDNAVKYNREEGDVEIITGEGKLTVKDTGVGIPEEHQAHVFERFYRVDKSHSRATGGTGLGLSIVKHGAQLMGAKVELKSQVGVGTEITLFFPQSKPM